MITIRKIKPNEYSFLEDMLYEAIFVPMGSQPFPIDIIKDPNLIRYIDDFGKKDDYCLIAECENTLIGAIWIRLFSKENKGYGYVDNSTPELSIALDKNHRGTGIGTRLLNQMLKIMIYKGYAQVSLSVDEKNKAFQLYKKHGFTIVHSKEASHIMVKKLI